MDFIEPLTPTALEGATICLGRIGQRDRMHTTQEGMCMHEVGTEDKDAQKVGKLE